uniref:Uncharacterized protein n=1 Tax=Ditylenchus dipsaci TaxID=166011 RepID=A0A915CTH3_9BILA
MNKLVKAEHAPDPGLDLAHQRKKQAEKIIKSLQREERVKAFEERIQRGEPGTSHLSPDTSEVESSDEDDQEK